MCNKHVVYGVGGRGVLQDVLLGVGVFSPMGVT